MMLIRRLVVLLFGAALLVLILPVQAAPSGSNILPQATLPAAQLEWVYVGGPLGGLGYDIRVHPEDPMRMFVSDAYAGVFTSTDGGQTWSASNKGITTRSGTTGDAIPVFSLSLDPNNPDILWAGTQFQRGIFKSVDGAKNWQKMDTGVIEKEGITFRGFTVQPGDSNVVYAAAELSSWAWNQGKPRNGREFDMTGGVVYKTLNGGKTWKEAWRGQNLARYIWINPQNIDIVYVSTGFFDREAANSDPVQGKPGGEGILKSTDAGQTWTAVNNGLGSLYVGSLFMHPTNPDILLAGTGNIQYSQGGGVYITTDGGSSWKQTLKDTNIESVEFSLSDPQVAYAGSSEAIYQSKDGGYTWQKMMGDPDDGWGAPGVRAGFPVDFQVDLNNPLRIFANEYGGGNFLSEDGGRNWVVASKGYTGAQVRAIAVDPQQPARVFAAARSGMFTSFDSGATWQGLNSPPVVTMEWNTVAIDPTNPQHVVASTNWGNRLLNSTNAGKTWKIGIAFPDQRVSWRAVAFAPSRPQMVYAGTAGYFSAGSFSTDIPGKGIYLSSNGGSSWQPANDALSQDAHVTALAVDPADPQRVYAATSNHGLLLSLDAGQQWMQVAGGLPKTGRAFSVMVHPANPLLMFAGYINGECYRSEDGGATWVKAASGMEPGASINSFAGDPANQKIVYASDIMSGVYRSENGGKSWRKINTGLLTRMVNAVALSSDGLHIYAVTEGNGVYRLDLAGQPPAAAPTATRLPTSTSRPTANVPTATRAATSAPTPAATATRQPVGPFKNLPCPANALLGGLVMAAVLSSKRRLERPLRFSNRGKG